MNVFNLKDFNRGWFVGDFIPTLMPTGDIEIAVKRYKAGESEGRHVHKIATELTLIVSGKVRMNNEEYIADDIIEILPNEPTDFFAIEDTVTLVVKTPSVPNDKYSL